MAVILYGPKDSPETPMTTGLNSLADGANALSSALSNDAATTERRLFCDAKLALATQGAARSAGAYVNLYIIPEVNAVYGYGDGSVDPPAHALKATFLFTAVATAETDVVTGIELPNADFKFLIMNETGQAFASSGNTLVIERYSLES